jgi:hypothetical protein
VRAAITSNPLTPAARCVPPPPTRPQGLVASGQLQGGEDWLANPALPDDVVRDSMPGGRTGGRVYNA